MIQPLRGLLWPEFALRGDAEPLRAPLWPAGHLPHKGGIMPAAVSPLFLQRQ